MEERLQRLEQYKQTVLQGNLLGMTEKGKYSPRPRFHILFPIDEIRDKEKYRQLKESVIAYFPYFDVGAKDSARFFYGVTDPVVEIYGGDTDGTE